MHAHRIAAAAALLLSLASAGAQEAAPAASPAPASPPAAAQPAAAPAPAAPAAAVAPVPAPVAPPAPKGAEPTLKVGGYVHADGRLFIDDDAKKLTDDLLIRRARADLQGKLGRFGGRLVLDFGGGKAVVQDAYAEAKLPLDLKLRFGKQTPPIGLERLHSSNGNVFVEYALPAYLSPARDVGLLLTRDLAGIATLAVGLFDGAADGASPDGDVSDDKDVVARVFVRPFARAGIPLLSNLGLGVAGSFGSTHGDPKATDLSGYKTDGQATFFDFRRVSTGQTTANTTIASGRRTRVSAQGSWFAGPALLLAEYAVSQQRVLFDGQVARPKTTSWQATGAWTVTGETPSENGVVPKAPLDAGGVGALQVKARVASLDVDDDLFPIFAKPEEAASKATAFGAGLTWWATGAVRVELDYAQTSFEGGAGTSGAVEDRPDEKAILSRLQVVF
jgi:phosphate-selective porin OprO/OprP